jgi:hypothetical protein
MIKKDLVPIVEKAIALHRGRAKIVEVAKYIWDNHESDLRASGNLLYTWQYDMRWSANSLRRSGKMKPQDVSPKGIWELA